MLGSLRKSCVSAGRNLLPGLLKRPGKTGVSAKNGSFWANRVSSGCQHLFHTTAQSNEKNTSKPYGSHTAPYVATKGDRQQFHALFDDLVKDLTESRHLDIPDNKKHFAKLLYYTIPGGKNIRAMVLYNSYRMLVPENEATEENKRLVMTMGWCIEILHSFTLLLDDLMDGAEERRGKPCWYRVDNLGNLAINDGLLLESAIYMILRRYFRDKPYYTDALEFFHDKTLTTMLGQSLDTLSCTSVKNSLEHFNVQLHKSIVKYKTSDYSFYFPVAMAMTMAGIKDPELYRQAENILLEIGHLFQVQDDFMDEFGSFKLTGKTRGTDITTGKCSWLAVVALERANPEQRRIMDECYGKPDPEKVAAVRQLYETLDLPSAYATYKEEAHNRIKSNIQRISSDLPAEIFLGVLDTACKRSG